MKPEIKLNFHIPAHHQIHGQPPATLGGIPMGAGISPQPGFVSRGVFLPIYDTFVIGQAKTIV